MDGTSPRQPPGRPAVLQEDQRRALVLDAAARVFFSHGYAASTMSAIAVEARMSKKTLYQVFPSKLALFDALLENRIVHVAPPPDPGACTQVESLSRLILAMADLLLRPDRTALIRLIITDGQASPELATAFERLKMHNKLNALEAWLAAEMAIGALPPGDVDEIAHVLFGMTIAQPILLALVRSPEAEKLPSIEHRIRTAVGIFLRGLAGCDERFTPGPARPR